MPLAVCGCDSARRWEGATLRPKEVIQQGLGGRSKHKNGGHDLYERGGDEGRSMRVLAFSRRIKIIIHQRHGNSPSDEPRPPAHHKFSNQKLLCDLDGCDSAACESFAVFHRMRGHSRSYERSAAKIKVSG